MSPSGHGGIVRTTDHVSVALAVVPEGTVAWVSVHHEVADLTTRSASPLDLPVPEGLDLRSDVANGVREVRDPEAALRLSDGETLIGVVGEEVHDLTTLRNGAQWHAVLHCSDVHRVACKTHR